MSLNNPEQTDVVYIFGETARSLAKPLVWWLTRTHLQFKHIDSRTMGSFLLTPRWKAWSVTSVRYTPTWSRTQVQGKIYFSWGGVSRLHIPLSRLMKRNSRLRALCRRPLCTCERSEGYSLPPQVQLATLNWHRQYLAICSHSLIVVVLFPRPLPGLHTKFWHKNSLFNLSDLIWNIHNHYEP